MTDRKFVVYAHTTASASLTITVSEDQLRAVAENLGKTPADLTADDLREHVIYRAFQTGFPDICAQCSGWGRSGSSLELGDDWALDSDDDPNDTSDVVEITNG